MTIRGESLEPGDADLLALARGGDSSALELLVIPHQGVVYRFLLGFLKDEDQAADTAQDTFLKALDRLDGFRGAAPLIPGSCIPFRSSPNSSHMGRVENP